MASRRPPRNQAAATADGTAATMHLRRILHQRSRRVVVLRRARRGRFARTRRSSSGVTPRFSLHSSISLDLGSCDDSEYCTFLQG
jgi:hypothetical protein